MQEYGGGAELLPLLIPVLIGSFIWILTTSFKIPPSARRTDPRFITHFNEIDAIKKKTEFDDSMLTALINLNRVCPKATFQPTGLA
ncbi:hypothetical protein [Cognatiyoonia sp. IB215182]|uniref:hypothetical protein n=1 Tax=Cognatiyoonia sp. IB215182 TaxID=3097353 RepID=UPI002A0EB9BA|nr:hypothetical protein [Cognatiyoonia sp. IB215182]MDX8352469.1 hypothetical protein [Cognatiyoonia sp. IB215182]